MRDVDDAYAPLAPKAATLGHGRDWTPALQLAPWAASPQMHGQERHARFARQIEAAVLRDLGTYRR